VQRAVAARLAGRDDSALTATERAYLTPLLLGALEDAYPAVRTLAWRSLWALGVGASTDFDALAPLGVRRRIVEELSERWKAPGPGRPPTGFREFLAADAGRNERAISAWRAAQRNPDIRIGE
jgi:hypothetical protein